MSPIEPTAALQVSKGELERLVYPILIPGETISYELGTKFVVTNIRLLVIKKNCTALKSTVTSISWPKVISWTYTAANSSFRAREKVSFTVTEREVPLEFRAPKEVDLQPLARKISEHVYKYGREEMGQ